MEAGTGYFSGMATGQYCLKNQDGENVVVYQDGGNSVMMLICVGGSGMASYR